MATEYQVPARARCRVPQDLPLTSQRFFYQHAITHPQSLDHALRFFQALTPEQALAIYTCVATLAEKYDDLPLPHDDALSYRAIQQHLQDYMIWCFDHGWRVCPF